MFNQVIRLENSINIYLTWKSRSIRSAHSRYKPRLEAFTSFIGTDILLSELTGDHITDFHNQMEKDEYSDATIAFSTRVIRNFVVFWNGRGATNINPVEIKARKFLTPEQPVVDEEDFEQMSELLDESYIDELQRKLAIHLLWDTGMRVSELTSLKLENLNQTKEGTRTARIKTRKTDRYNVVMWSTETEELLFKYLGWRLSQSHPTDFLFIRTDTKSTSGITTKTIERWVQKLSREALIGKPITPHSFRHGKAHHILNQGGTAIDVQTVLRHKNLNSSLNYMRLNESKYIERAGRFFDSAKQTVQGRIKSGFKNELACNTRVIYNAH